MAEKSQPDKLSKNQLKLRIGELENKLTKDRHIRNISAIVAIALGIILIVINILPSFAGINVVMGGENIELTNKSNGEWEIRFITTGFVPANNIDLHVKFLDDHAEINYDSLFFSISPDVRKLEKDNEFEYKWNSHKGEIIIFVQISSNYNLKNNTFVQISTSRGTEYRHWGTEGIN